MTDPIRSALEAARTQIVNLNGALDDFWNDPERPSVAKMRSGTVSNLSIAQLDARASLAKIDAALASLDAPQPDAIREAILTPQEIGLLREIDGQIPPSPWGAWVGVCLESLKGGGYIGGTGGLTDKGRAALARLKGEGEKPDPIEDDDPSRADEDWFFDHDGKP